MLEGVDVSYAQGNYQPGAEQFVIINASRANVGLVSGSMYRAQVANARAAGKHVGHYFFNGNIDPVRCANFFVDNLAYQPGDTLWLDVESEAGTNTVAWSPAEALAFIQTVRSRLGVVPGVYLNRSLMDGFDWSQVVATGAPLWIAYYNPSPPPIRWWSDWAVWQYTSNPIDRNKAQSLIPAGGGAVPIPIVPEEDEDVNGFYVQLVGDGSGPKYWFSPSTGKLRKIGTPEWLWLRAAEGTHTTADTIDVKLPILNVSQEWLTKALAL